MCGIAGTVALNPSVKLEILRNLEIRGRDGFGFWTLDVDRKEVVSKTTEPASFAVGGSRHAALDSVIHPVLANTRAIPSTEFHTGAGRDLKHQQPFTSSRYALVFNGLIANDRELVRKYQLQVETSVDTAMLLPLFEKLGVIEGMKQLDGAFAIILYDKIDKKLYFGRNFLPLHYCFVGNSGLGVASLKEMFPKHIQDSVKEVSPYSCVTYDEKTQKLTKQSLYRKAQNKKVMIIFSGGMDSVVTAYIYKHLGYKIKLVHFNYGQAAQEVENQVVHDMAKHLKADLTVINAKTIFKSYAGTSKLLNQKMAKDEEQSLDAESTLSYVPNRNATLAMFVAGLAEVENYDTVAFGAQQMDSVYPDNTPDFVAKINAALKVSLNWQTNVKFTAPLVHLMKHEIIQLAIDLDVPLEAVTSCYYPELVAKGLLPKVRVCGKCGPCQVRDATFTMLGIEDPQKGGKKGEGKRDIERRDYFINSYVKTFV